MLYILDTADLDAIKHCNEYYPLAGVTTNPSIIAKENTDFWVLVKEIRKIIGDDKMLHIQTTQDTAEKIVEEAKLLKYQVGGNFYVKIPISEEGLKAVMMLKEEDQRRIPYGMIIKKATYTERASQTVTRCHISMIQVEFAVSDTDIIGDLMKTLDIVTMKKSISTARIYRAM